MISFIISSHRDDFFRNLKRNIKNTIGETTFEIIKISNPGVMSLSEAYNRGGGMAKYENLVFLHEDIEFLNKNWGDDLLEVLETENVGIVGLAGCTRKFSLPTGHDLGLKKNRYVYVTHFENEKTTLKVDQKKYKVKTLDGVFLATKKNRWQELPFNENITGFHFYDLDFSLRTSLKFQNYVISTIKIKHYSLGNFNDSWIIAALKFHKKNYNFDLSSSQEKSITRNFWYRRLMFESISLKNRMKYLHKMGVDKKSLINAFKFLFISKIRSKAAKGRKNYNIGVLDSNNR